MENPTFPLPEGESGPKLLFGKIDDFAGRVTENKVGREEEEGDGLGLGVIQGKDGSQVGADDVALSGSSVVWRPLRVYDDGIKTYLQMSPDMASYEAPALFVIEDKQPLLVNYRVKQSIYIVDRLFDRGQLRVGAKTAVDIRCTHLAARASH